MNATSWTTAKSGELITHLKQVGDARDRRRRLVNAGMCREYWPKMRNGASRLAVEAAEQFADGLCGREEMIEACEENARELVSRMLGQTYDTKYRLSALAGHASNVHQTALFDAWGPSSQSRLAAIIRGIFGNPFRPVAFDPAWRTSTAVALAAAMYESRDFGLLPVLADALEEAGCDAPDLLAHCRGPGPHVRGCWAVDLVLGKG